MSVLYCMIACRAGWSNADKRCPCRLLGALSARLLCSHRRLYTDTTNVTDFIVMNVLSCPVLSLRILHDKERHVYFSSILNGCAA